MKKWEVKKRTKDTDVKKDNRLARARIETNSVWDGRIINSVYAQIKTEDEDFKRYEVAIKDIIPESYNNKGQSGFTIREIKKSAERVCEKILTFEDKKTGFTVLCPFIYCNVNDGIITVEINPYLKEYLLNLKGKFTNFKFSDFLNLSTTYSQRLFEVLSSWKNKDEGYVDISLPVLHEQLNTMGAYRATSRDFLVLIERCKKDIDDKNTELKFEYEGLKKQGSKKVVSVRFVLDAEKFELYKKSLTAKNTPNNKSNKPVEEYHASFVKKPLAKAVIKPLKGLGFAEGSFDEVFDFEEAV